MFIPMHRLLLLLLVVCCAADAATYYVSAARGSDVFAGTREAPFKTIQKAADRMGPGDSCVISGGIYRETITPKASGTAGQPIVFTSAPNETVFVSAGEPITGWTLDKGKIYKAAMDWDLGQGRNQLFANGDMMYEARIPNVDEPERSDMNVQRNAPTAYVPAGPINPAFMTGGASTKGAGVHKLYIGTTYASGVKLHRFLDSCRLANAPQDFLAGAMVHKTGGFYTSETGITTIGWGVEPSGSQLFPNWMWVRITVPNWQSPGGRFAFVGKREFLDAPKEWWWDNGTIYFYPPGDKDPNTLLIEAKRRQLVMDLRDRNYIEVRKIRFLGGSVTMKGSNNCVLDACHFRYITHWTLFHGYDMRYRYNGESAFYIEGNNNKFINSSIEYSAGSGLYIMGINNLVENSLIRDCNYVGTYDVGVATGNTVPGSNTVTRNSLYNMGRSAWTLTPGTPGLTMSVPQKVTYNMMYNTMFLVDDGGSVYLAGDNGGGSEIAYNWFFNMIQKYNCHHIYYDWGGGYHTFIHHNVFWQDSLWMSENNPITTAPMRHVTYNNTSIQKPKSDFYLPFDDDERGVNALWAEDKPEEWGIKDWKNRDFTLVAGSRAIDKGTWRADSQYIHLWDFPNYRSECYLIDTPVVIPASKVTGSKPDLGAYEFGLPAWKPGHSWGEVVWRYPPSTVTSVSYTRISYESMPRYRFSRTGLSISVPGAPAFDYRVLDVAGRTIISGKVERGLGEHMIPRSVLPSTVLIVKVSAGTVSRTFSVNPLR